MTSTAQPASAGGVAVVTIARGRHDHLRRQHRSLALGTRAPDHYVLVAMSDPVVASWPGEHGLATHTTSVDDTGPMPLAKARNAGARAALELGAQTLVFLDVDCLGGPDLVAAYGQVVQQLPGTIWSGPVTYLPAGLTEDELRRPWTYDDPHPSRPAPAPGELVPDADPDLFWSLSYAMDSRTWERIGGFCEDYVGYGGEDTDFAHQAVERGVAFGWVGAARAYHQHHPTQSPPTQHLDEILRNASLFHRRWGRWPMLGWLEQFEERGLVDRTADGWVRRPVPTAVQDESASAATTPSGP